MSKKLEINLKDTCFNSDALWIIVDPWQNQPGDYFEEETDRSNSLGIVTQHNKNFLPKIISYIKNVKHVCVSCPIDRLSIVKELKQYYNIEDCELKLIEYLIDNHLDTVVYIGYHYGICINERNCGTQNINQFIKNLQENLNQVWQLHWNTYKGIDWPSELLISEFDTLPTETKKEILDILPLSFLLKFKNSCFFNKKNKIKLFVKKDLCCAYPYDLVHNHISKKFATLI